jgi:transcriptional regulator with XRE-family HTH domain
MEIKNDVLVSIGEKIQELRLSKGITQKDIAESLGLGQTIVAYWEKGEREIKATTVAELANLFGVTPNYLMGYEDTIVMNMNKNEVLRFSEKDIEVLKVIQENKEFMKYVRTDTAQKISEMLKLWKKVISVIK